jgi:hypothetical protein
MSRGRLVLIVLCALAIGLAAGYLLRRTAPDSIEERARGAAERLKGAVERVTR